MNSLLTLDVCFDLSYFHVRVWLEYFFILAVSDGGVFDVVVNFIGIWVQAHISVAHVCSQKACCSMAVVVIKDV